MDAESWLADFAQRLGVAPLSEADLNAVLDLARVAAHQSERKAAPVACFLAARAGLSPAEAVALVGDE